MNIVRVCIHRPGDTAEQLVTKLAERRAAVVVARDPRVRGLLTKERDRGRVLADFERHLDDIARELESDD